MLTRLKRVEDGFALVTAVAILAIMTLLLVVVLAAGNSAFNISERNSRYTRTLAVAEAGIDDAVAMLSRYRQYNSPCPRNSGNTCTPAGGGQYQVDWTTAQDGTLTVTSVGYFPSKANAKITRTIRAVYQPIPEFQYALYSNTTFTIANGQVVLGDVFSNGTVTMGSNAIVCGSITVANGNIDLSTNGNGFIYKNYSYTDTSGTHTCSNKTGRAWAGGSIYLGSGSVVQGDATASAPVGTSCPPSSAPLDDTYYAIEKNPAGQNGGTVSGTATACGRIATTATTTIQTRTDPPPTGALPSYEWDPCIYTSDCHNQTIITCIPYSDPCNPQVTSPTATQQFNSLNKSSMRGVYAIWQTNPSQSTMVDLTGLTVGGNLTIWTNAPVYFGNTSPITASGPANVVIASLYVPGASTTCDTTGGDCSIYGQNAVVFDSGAASDPNDGIAALLYSPGKCAFKNSANAAEGAIYCGSLDIKNGFSITYNSRILKVAGFGGNLQQVLWQELSG